MGSRVRVPVHRRCQDDNGQRIPLEPYKFIVCHIAGKSGIPIRGGLARAAAWAWMFKNFAVKDWVQFCEVYGVPFRLGKYAPGSSEDDINALLAAVVSIASDAGAAIPNNMDISIIETKGAGGSSDGGVFGGLAKYFDEQMSKAVLGQTGTTDSTGAKGLGSGNEHQEVREDIERASAQEPRRLARCDAGERPRRRSRLRRLLRPRPGHLQRQAEADLSGRLVASKRLAGRHPARSR
jgi:phage gp29-like protein